MYRIINIGKDGFMTVNKNKKSEGLWRSPALSCLILLMGIIFLTGCTVTTGIGLGTVTGSGPMLSRDFTPGDFNSVDISGSYAVSFFYNSNFSVRINMQENLFEFLEVEIRNYTLHISSGRNFNTTSANRPHIYIYAPSLTALSFAGAVDTARWDLIEGERFSINTAGAANITLDLDVDFLEISAAGASDVSLSGRADTADISTAGASSVSALGLLTANTAVSIAGAGNVDIAVSDSLNASIAGAGRIRYLGEPDIVQSIAGLGTIRRY